MSTGQIRANSNHRTNCAASAGVYFQKNKIITTTTTTNAVFSIGDCGGGADPKIIPFNMADSQ